MQIARPLALVTNDDGIDSPFLRVLVEALAEDFQVVVAAPKCEQSWIGRAMSRRRDVRIEKCALGDVDGWVIDGTPTDCVNIALGHLLNEQPSVVVSGINIGFNTSMPLLLSSGTLAGAIEGAHWGLPAVAASQSLPSEVFNQLQEDRSRIPEALQGVLQASAKHVAEATKVAIAEGQPGLIVHNLNYPPTMAKETQIAHTLPSQVSLGSLYGTDDGETFRFAFQGGTVLPSPDNTDRSALNDGFASWTRLNFSKLGESFEVEKPL